MKKSCCRSFFLCGSQSKERTWGDVVSETPREIVRKTFSDRPRSALDCDGKLKDSLGIGKETSPKAFTVSVGAKTNPRISLSGSHCPILDEI